MLILSHCLKILCFDQGPSTAAEIARRMKEQVLLKLVRSEPACMRTDDKIGICEEISIFMVFSIFIQLLFFKCHSVGVYEGKYW